MFSKFNKKVNVLSVAKTADGYGSHTVQEGMRHYQLPCYIYNDTRDESVVQLKVSVQADSIMLCRNVTIQETDIVRDGSIKYEVVYTRVHRSIYRVVALKLLE